jgi:hypothetical protein
MPIQAQRGGGGIAPTHLQPDIRRWTVSSMLQPLYPQEGRGTPCTGVLMGLGAGLDGTKISSPPAFDPRTVQPISESLYRLHHPGRHISHVISYNEHGDNAQLWVYENLIFAALPSICTSNLKFEHERL